MTPSATKDAERRIGQEGSRWYNELPSGEDVAAWFEGNVPLHEGLEASNYVQGITLIPNVEKASSVIGWDSDNHPLIAKRENLVYTPYAKVETRVKYWHDLMAQHDDWVGVIEPVTTAEQDPRLPEGFFPFAIATGPNAVVRYICCSMKATIYKAGTVEFESVAIDRLTGKQKRVRKGEVIQDAPPATKMIAMLGYQNRPDNFALMKAETGAVGRALGMAGMLVLPGSGVATAEDLQEAADLEGRPPAAAPEEAEVPAESANPEETIATLRLRAAELLGDMKENHAELFKGFQEWTRDRGIKSLNEVTDERILRGMVTKAERELAEATATK